MADMKIIDKNAKSVLLNTGLFRLPYGGSDAARQGIVFEPGVLYKVEEDDWTKGQPTLEVQKSLDDPAAQEKAEATKEAARLERNGPDPVKTPPAA